MDVFVFREELVAEYERFSESFANVRAEDISGEADAAYAAGHFWPPRSSSSIRTRGIARPTNWNPTAFGEMSSV